MSIENIFNALLSLNRNSFRADVRAVAVVLHRGVDGEAGWCITGREKPVLGRTAVQVASGRAAVEGLHSVDVLVVVQADRKPTPINHLY